ncbi:hypothetical protein ES707_16041 [subsurface metagenome]
MDQIMDRPINQSQDPDQDQIKMAMLMDQLVIVIWPGDQVRILHAWIRDQGS